ncbi:hypothetical protein MOSE0_N13520 [Monosporozyma servazzii]
MDFDNNIRNATTSNSFIPGQLTDHNRNELTSIINSQDAYVPSSTSTGVSVPTETSDIYLGGSSIPPSISSTPSSSEEYPISTKLFDTIPSATTDLYSHSVSSQIEAASQPQQSKYSSSIPESSSSNSIHSQPQPSSLDITHSTIPTISSLSSTNSGNPSTNNDIISSSHDSTLTSFIYSYQPTSSSRTTTTDDTNSSSGTPSTTLVIHKSDLPGRSSLGEQLSSYLSAHSISSSSGNVVPIPSFHSFKNSTTTLYSRSTSIEKTSYTSYPSATSSDSLSLSSHSIVPSDVITSSSSTSSTSSVIFDPRYSTYTQEYFFTGKTTSFSTGIPITLTLEDHSKTTTRPTVPVISAPIQVYNKWLNDGQLDDPRNEHTTNIGTIVGSVVGAVGGIVLCGVMFWMFKRRRSSRNRNLNDGSIKGPYTGYASNEEEEEDSTIFPINYMGDRMKYDSTNRHDPFKHEFEFDKRTPPPIPEPRKGIKSHGMEPIPKLATANNNASAMDDYHLRFSYVSTETGASIDSSTVGSYSTISSTPNRYGIIDNNKQGFLREIV